MTFRFPAARAAALVVLAALACSCARQPPGRSDAEIVVAEVDNVPVSLRDVKGEILSARGYSPTLEERGIDRAEVSEAIRALVERYVVLREGGRRGITVPFAALEEEVMRYRADFPEGGLEKALVQVGMNAEEWRERVRGSLLYRRSADAIASSLVSVTPEEVAEAYRKEAKPAGRPERIRLRQFLFESESLAESAREGLLERFRGGAADAGADGVDLGFFSREELPPDLPPELFDLEAGAVSRPVALDCSVSLFRVEAREPAGAHTLESEEGRIRESLLAARREEAFRRWLSRASMNASVRVRAELLKKLYEEKR